MPEVKRFGRRLGSVVSHHDFSARQQCEWSVSQPSSRIKLVYCDSVSEDETPMHLALLQQLDVDPVFIRQVTGNQTAIVPLQSASLPVWSATKARSKTIAKLVQSDQGYSYLTCDESLKDFQSHTAKQLTWIQLTDSTSGENALHGEKSAVV